MLKGTKKIFPKEYDYFKESMLGAAEEGALPIGLQLDDTDGLTLSDIRDLLYEFNLDTGLKIEGIFFVCEDCGKLHILFEIDYPDNDEERIIQ